MSILRPVPKTFGTRPLVQCAGGFCESRAVCAHYYAPGLPNREPVDRLCPPDHEDPEPMDVANHHYQLLHKP